MALNPKVSHPKALECCPGEGNSLREFEVVPEVQVG